MKKRTRASGARLAADLELPRSRGIRAVVKARLISAVLAETDRQGLTHAELARRARIPRSTATGISSGSLQRVGIDRILRLVEAVGLEAGIRVHRAA